MANSIRNLRKSLAVAVLAAASVLAAHHEASAQQQPVPPVRQFGPRVQQGGGGGAVPQAAPASKADIIAKEGDWVVQCEDVSPGKDKNGNALPSQRSCGMLQTAKDPKRPQVTLTLIIVNDKRGDKSATMMRVMAPIMTFLPTGVALEIDGSAVGRVPFVRCLPQLCMAVAEARPETLAKMKKGNVANFIIYEAPGVAVNMPISLKGFTASLDALLKQ